MSLPSSSSAAPPARPATVLLYAALAVPALAAALLGGISGRIAPQAAAHLAFATGMLPLIL
ncbi:MAG: hypothetical protein JNJ60_24560, partial [Rhodocyclaceae bacterium]|nr:hypothetical protein [Rhodocyclaceae bacterium]